MKLLDLIHRSPTPQPWQEGEKIPWNDPEFSRRMLREHLTQEHDLASRRFEIIDRQVKLVHTRLLEEKPSRILDLGCGPGFYSSRLARLGHSCVGFDFSPASIEFARDEALRDKLDCSYHEQDLRVAEFGAGFDLAMFIYGEFNVFRTEAIKKILSKVAAALTPQGQLLLEPQSLAAVHKVGTQPASWFSSPAGLFSEKPHLCLQESFWYEQEQATVQRFYVVDAETSEVTLHSATSQGYTDYEYRAMLTECGFADIEFFPTLAGKLTDPRGDLFAIVAKLR
ncbi:MAG: class I SAM-dependent methyltransferase [bacterium]